MVEGLRPPELLTAAHDASAFQSDEPALDNWLVQRALINEGLSSRTYVVCDGGAVVGYYALAAGSVQRSLAVPRMRRNAPDPIPVMVLGRLAVDRRWQGRGIGRGLLRDAVLRALHVAETAGVAALLVHAISDRAKRFYLGQGFLPSTAAPMTLMITVADLRMGLQQA